MTMRKAILLLAICAAICVAFLAGLNVGYDRGRDDEQASYACPCDQCDCGPPMDTKGDSHVY